jgi:hypothetical protein
MNSALILDSLTPATDFDELPDMVHIVDVWRRERRAQEDASLRPYSEVAAMMYLTGVTPDVPSVQQVADIERRALRKLRNHPRMRALLRDLR